MAVEIHATPSGDLIAVRPDPYVWVDPFAEAEEWALLWARSATGRAQELHELRQEHQRREAHLQGVIEAQQRVMMDWAATHPPAVFLQQEKKP